MKLITSNSLLLIAVIASAIEACIDTDAKDCEGTAPVRDSDSPVCNVVGYCDSASTSYGYTFANTLNECIQMCKDDPRCTWYSYNSDEECFQMPDCQTLRPCMDCYVSGEVSCPLEPQEMPIFQTEMFA